MTTSNQKNIPALRFKEFDGEWEKDEVSNLFIIKVGGTINKENVSSFKNKEFPYPIYANAEKKKGLYGYSNVYKFKGGAVTIAGRGNIGIAHARNHAFSPTVSLLVLIPKKDADIYFYEYAFNNLNFFIEGTGVPQLTSRQLSTRKVFFPSLPEQQKIARFLTAIDQKINQLSQKVQLQERYKKGVMQKLFSQELRFKDADGKDFADWEVKTFESIYDFVRTNSFSRNLLNYESGNIKNIHYGDIHTKFNSLFDLKNENVPFINQDVDVSKIKVEDYCKEGDLIIADASEDYNDVGKSMEIIRLHNEKLVAGLHTYIARPKIAMALGFSCYLMQSWDLRKKIMKIATGISVLGISKANLGKLVFNLPSLPEQQKIAHFLSQLDEQIQQTRQQLAHLQDYKKGLLQQLFV